MDNGDVYWGVLIPATVRDTAFFISLQSFIIMSRWLFLLVVCDICFFVILPLSTWVKSVRSSQLSSSLC